MSYKTVMQVEIKDSFILDLSEYGWNSDEVLVLCWSISGKMSKRAEMPNEVKEKPRILKCAPDMPWACA